MELHFCRGSHCGPGREPQGRRRDDGGSKGEWEEGRGEEGSWRPALETLDHRPVWAVAPRSCAEAASRWTLVWIFSWASPIKNEIMSCKHRTLCPSIKHRPRALTPGRQETAGTYPSLRKAQMKGAPAPPRGPVPSGPMRGGGRGRWRAPRPPPSPAAVGTSQASPAASTLKEKEIRLETNFPEQLFPGV